jgi:cobalamin biosynthesis protein CobC
MTRGVPNQTVLGDASQEPLYHGGDLEAARRLFPSAPAAWLDLSTGINVVPYPIGEIPPRAWGRLPEKHAVGALESIAAAAYGGGPDQVVAAPRTQALLHWLARLTPTWSVAILGFTYGEHERVWRQAGARVGTVDDLAALALADVAIVVNPNSPDGRLVSADALLDLSAALARRSGTLIGRIGRMRSAGSPGRSRCCYCWVLLAVSP